MWLAVLVHSKRHVFPLCIGLFHTNFPQDVSTQFQITNFSRFGSVWSRFYQLFGLRVFYCILFIQNWEFERRSRSDFVKQIICNLVSSCIVMHIDDLLVNIWKWIQFSYVCQKRGSPWLSALEIFHNNSCLLELRGVEYLDTHAFSPGPSRGRIRWSFLLLWLWLVII